MMALQMTPRGETPLERQKRRDALLTYGGVFAPVLRDRFDPQSATDGPSEQRTQKSTRQPSSAYLDEHGCGPTSKRVQVNKT